VSDLRIGLGIDAHALEPGVPLVLGGVSFDSPRGLAGHSDGDVIAHALIDALLGAAGLGDIGTLFPPDDPELKGVSSVKLLREAYAQVRRAGFVLVNTDVVFIGQEPRIGPVRAEMQRQLAAALDLDDAAPVSVRATTTDRLGFTGRGEGLAAQAVALLERST
jgi:2-C-methyl-D-erythritol 2,4-cyclodiphosphate synthase